MDEDDPSQECEVCGGTSFYKEAGHFYCNECQTQSQQIREQVFEQEETGINKKSTRKIKKDDTKKIEDKLTSWECYNAILKGLTEEIIELGASPQIKVVVKCLWMKYLHKCEVFDVKSDRPPKVSILGSKKDISILYNVRKRKRRRNRTSSTSTTQSVKRQRSNKKRALIHSQYDELSQSQTLTQDSTMAAETLSSLKSHSEKSDGSDQIAYNRFSNAQLRQMMSKKHRREHKQDIARQMSCHKFRTRDFSETFVLGPTNLTSFTLYSLLYIGLLIIDDDIQLGDILRFIREGHLSFGCYRHFFNEDMKDSLLNLPRKNDKLFSNEYFRKKTAKLVHFLNLEPYIESPNLVKLCSRYCTELNLPEEVFKCVQKLILRTAPRMAFTKKTTEMPNYEARAMSFILFTLKLLFGLDGVTEMKHSDLARMLNDRLQDIRMFVFQDWLKYISYRDCVVSAYNMPYALKNYDNVDSDMYLEYLKNQEITFKNTSRHIQSEVKDYLQILDKLVDSDCERESKELKFKSSLTSFSSCVEVVLDAHEISCKDVLEQNFSDDSLDFLFRPNGFLKLLGNQKVKNGGANDNIVSEDVLHIYKNLQARKKFHNTVTVKCSTQFQADRNIKEYFEEGKNSLTPRDINVLLSNWQKGNEKQFLKNQALLAIASENEHINTKECSRSESYNEHFNAFERYWLNIPFNPTVVRNFSKKRMDQIMSKFSLSLKIILKEFTRIIEQENYHFYPEFLVTELNLVYFEGYCSKSKKVRAPGLQGVLKDCLKKW